MDPTLLFVLAHISHCDGRKIGSVMQNNEILYCQSDARNNCYGIEMDTLLHPLKVIFILVVYIL